MKKIERNVLKGFGHMERMVEERSVKRVYLEIVEGKRGKRDHRENGGIK